MRHAFARLSMIGIAGVPWLASIPVSAAPAVVYVYPDAAAGGAVTVNGQQQNVYRAVTTDFGSTPAFS
jgi:hypothetical protein